MPRTELRLVVGFALALSELILGGPGWAQDTSTKPTLNVVLDSGHKFISVTFAGGKPDSSKALDAAEWRVVAIPHSRTATPVVLELTPEFYLRRDGTKDQSQVRLVAAVNHPIPDGMDLIVVQFNPEGSGPSAIYKSPAKEAPTGVAGGTAVKQNPNRLIPASSKQNSAVYLSGLYSPAIGSPAQYSIDALVNPQFQLNGKNPCDPTLGFNAQVKTNQRPTVDPDSYFVSPTYNMFILGCGADSTSRFSGRSVLLSFNILGPEFEAKGKDLNLVSTAMLSNFFRVWPFWSKPTTTKEHFTAYLSPTLGLVLGTNTENGLQPSGSGTILRGVAGADFSARFIPPKSLVVKKVLLSATYRVWIPAFPEISTNTVMVPGSTKAKDIYSLSSAARNHVQSELDFMFTEAWGITLKDDYGRIPPAFRFVDNSASVGLVFMFSQAGNGKQKAQP
jgi:hypothetical protein